MGPSSNSGARDWRRVAPKLRAHRRLGVAEGRLGESVTLDDGVNAARACGIMILAQAKAALGSLERVERVVKLGGFVNSTGDFVDQPKVVNGASDLMMAVFGENGRHARSAVGVPVLPLGAAVEVDAIFAVRPA